MGPIALTFAGEALAIAVVLSYALAVGWQPSVVRAAVAGVLASLAWLVARPRDKAIDRFVLAPADRIGGLLRGR